MIKKLLYSLTFSLLLISSSIESNAQIGNCQYTYTTAGLNTNLSWLWAFNFLTVLDSVNLNYGNGYSVTVYPPTSSNSYTFPAAGTYNVCLTQYTHQLGSTVVSVCTYCDSITVSGPTNVNDLDLQDFLVSPNPSPNGQFKLYGLSENELSNLYCTDMMGKSIPINLNKVDLREYKIDIQGVTSGTYLFRWTNNQGKTFFKKIQVQ